MYGITWHSIGFPLPMPYSSTTIENMNIARDPTLRRGARAEKGRLIELREKKSKDANEPS